MDGFDMRFADVVKCAANLVMPMGWKCTADFWTVNHPNYPFSFPSCQRFATSGSSHYPCSVTDAMSCHSSDKATEASEMPKFVASPFQGCIVHECVLTLSEANFESL